MRSLRNESSKVYLTVLLRGESQYIACYIYIVNRLVLLLWQFCFFFIVLWLRRNDMEALHLMSEITRQIRQNKMKEAREKVYIIVILQEKDICFHPASP